MAIDIALDAEPDDFTAIAAFHRTFRQPKVSLIRCFALMRHLGSIAAAARREISKQWLRRVVLPIVGRATVKHAAACVTISVQPTAELYGMQRRLSRVIAPGIVTSEAKGVLSIAPAASTIDFDPAIEIAPFRPFAARVVSASIYAVRPNVDGSDAGEARMPSLLWRLTAADG